MTTASLLERPAPAQAPRQALDAWYTRCPVPTTFGIALQRGLLHEEFDGDADVSFRALQESSDPAVLQSHYTHTQPNSLRHGGNYPAIYAQASGARTRVVGLSFQRASQAILALPETGLRGVKDLKGRRLGVPRRPHEPVDHAYLSALRTYETALRSEGLSLADVQIVEHLITSAYIHDRPKQKTHFGAPEPEQNRKTGRAWSHTLFPLVRGEVDAIAVGGANATLFETQGGLQRVFDLATLPDSEQANNNSPLVFAVKEDLLQRRPDFVLRVLKRVLQAEGLARQQPQDARRALAVELATSEAALSAGADAQFIANLELDFAPFKVAALKSQVDFMARHGAIAAPFDVDAWLAPDPLVQARSELADQAPR